MEVVYKTLTVEELKKDYKDHHGFLFQGAGPSPDRSIELVCLALIEHKITKEFPKFVVKVSPNEIIFVYGDDFDSPTFFKITDFICTRMADKFKIDSLVNILG